MFEILLNITSFLCRYKLNAIVEDSTGSANFTIFGRLAQDLIHIPAQNLATSPGSDNCTLPTAIKAIIGHDHIFQVVPDVQRFRASAPSFKVLKIFTNLNTKGKNRDGKHLLIKCEEQLHSPTTSPSKAILAR